MRDESRYEQVGNIKIAVPKKRKNKKNGDNISLTTKVFVWFMFAAMLASFIAPLAYYLITTMSD